VTDVGALETGAPYMVMELLRGQDLSQLLHDHGALAVPVAVQYVLQACEALAEAHAIGIVHRDLKPANLFLTTRADGSPCIKVLDFGISKVSNKSGSGSDMGMTRTQSIMGSPLYMSPEQMASARDVDQRSDIWAIGTVLYELVTGRVPFEAETMPQLCTLVLHQDPPSPRSIRREVPEALDQAILRCLRKDRHQRYDNVATLAADLAVFAPDVGPRSAERISRVLSSSGMSSTALASSNMSALTASSATGSAWGATQTSRGSRAVWFGLVGVAAAAVLGLVLWKATSGHRTASPDVSAAAAVSEPPREPQTPHPVEAPPVVAPTMNAVEPPHTADSASAAASAASLPLGSKHPPAHVAAGKARADGKPKAPRDPGIDPLSERN
jgi:serine/threonine protein kinase